MRKINFSYKTAVKILISTILFMLLNGVSKQSFLSVPMFLSLLYLGFNTVLSAFCLAMSFLVNFSLSKIFSAVITIILVCPIFAFLKKKNKKVGAKILPISIIAVVPFLLTATSETYVITLIQALLCVMLTPLFISAGRVIFIKNFKYKCGKDELVCLAVFFDFTIKRNEENDYIKRNEKN